MLEWVQVTGGPLQGRQLYVDPDIPAWKAMAEGKYEPFIFEALGGVDGYHSKTVWDIGAFMGYHALAFATLVGPAGRVVTFEPNVYNAERVKLNLSRNSDLAPRISLIPQALSDQDCRKTFIFSRSIETGESSGSHVRGALLAAEASAYAAFEQSTVSTVRADTLLGEARVPPPALVKMDVEGAEFMVLAGATDMLARVRPTLLIEIHHVVAMFHVQQLLTSHGYSLAIVSSEDSVSSRCHILAKPGKNEN